MNGIHDMGGMHGMGPIEHEKNEPVFHERWEGRVYALNRALGGWGKWNLDASRHSREVIPPAEYLRMSYYEKWLTGLTDLAIKSGLVTEAEVASGKPAKGSVKATPPLTAEKVSTLVGRGATARRNVQVIRVFKWASGCALATYIRWATRGCRDTPAASKASSTATTASSFFLTPTLNF